MDGYIIGRASSALSHSAANGGGSPPGDSAFGQWAKILTVLLGVGGAAYFLHKYYRDSQFRSYIQSLLPKSATSSTLKDDSTPTTSVPTDEVAIKAAATVAGLAAVEKAPEEGGLAATLRQGFSSLAAMIDRKSAYLEQLEKDEQKKDQLPADSADTPSSSSSTSASKEGAPVSVDDFDKGALKDSDILASYFPHLAHPEQTEWPTWLEQITCAIQEEVNKLLAYLDKPIDFATDIGSSTFPTSSTTSVATSQIADALVSAGVMSSSPSSSVVESLPEVPPTIEKESLSDSQIRSTAEGIFVLARVLLRQHFHHLLMRPESMPVPLMETISPAQQEEMKVQEELQRQQRRQLRKTQKRNKLPSDNPLQDTSASTISSSVSASKDEIHMDDIVINILQQTVPKEIGYWCASQDCFSTAEWFLEEGFDWLPQGTEPVEALKYLRTLLERIFASHSHLELHDPSVVGHAHKSNSSAKAAQHEEEETHNKLVRANQLATKRGLHLLELLLAREDYYDFTHLPVSQLDQPTHSNFDCGMEIISWLLTGLMTTPECTGAYPPSASAQNKLGSSQLKNQVQAEDFVDPIWVEGALGLLMDKGASVMGTKSWLHPTLSSLPYHGSLGIYGLSDLQSGFVSPVLLTWLRTLANANNASLSSFPEIKEMFRRSDGLTAVDILLLRGQNEPEMWKREWQKLSLMLLATMPDDRAKALNTIPPFSSAFSSGTFSGYNAGSSINSSAVSLGKVSADWLGVPLDLEERIASFCQQYLDPFSAYSAFSLDCLEDPWMNEDKAIEAWNKLMNEIVPSVISPQDDHEDDNMESQSARDNLLFWKEMTPSELGWLRHMVRWCLVKQFYRLAYVLLRMGLPGEFYSIEEEEKLRGLDGPSSFSSARDVGSSNRYRYVGSNLQLLLWQMFQPVTFRHSRQNQPSNAEDKDNNEPILQARIQLLEIMLQNGRYVLEILPYFDSSSDRGDADLLQQQKRHNSLQGPPIVDVLQGLCLNSPYVSHQQQRRGHRRARLATAVGHVSSGDLHRVLDILTKNGLVSVNNSVFWWSFVPSSSSAQSGSKAIDDLVPTFTACRGNVLHFCVSQLQLNYLYPVLDFLCSGEDPLHKRQHKRHRRGRRGSLKGKDKDIASLTTTLTSDDCKKQLQWPEERNAWQLLESRPDVQMALQGRSRYIPQKWGKDLRQWLTPRPEDWELLSARQIRNFAATSAVPHNKKRGRKPRNKQQPQQQQHGKQQEMTNYFSNADKTLKEDSTASVGEDLVNSQLFDVAEGNVAVLSPGPESAEDLESSFVSIHTGLGTEEKIEEISLRPHSTLMDNLAQEMEEKKEQQASTVPSFIPEIPQQQQQDQHQEQIVQLPSVTELPSPLPQPPPIVDDSAVLPNPEPDVVSEFTKVQVLEELPVVEEGPVPIPQEANEEPIPPLDDKEEWPTVEEAKHILEEEHLPHQTQQQQQTPSPTLSNIQEDYSPAAPSQVATPSSVQREDQNLQVKVETTTVQVQTTTVTKAESVVETPAAPLPNPIIKQYEIDEEVVSHLSSAEPEIIENFTKVVVITKDDLVKEQQPTKENVEQAPLPDLKDKSAWPSLQETSSTEGTAVSGGEKSQFSENR